MDKTISIIIPFATEPMVDHLPLQPISINNWEEAVGPDDDEYDYYYLEGTKPQLLQIISKWINLVMDHAVVVSGDDEYFDYYPENFDIMDHILAQFPNPHLAAQVEEARQFAYDVRYYDLEPSIIPWEEVEEYEKRRNKKLSEAAEAYRKNYLDFLTAKYHNNRKAVCSG